MTKATLALLLFALTLLGGRVWAKDICVQDNYGSNWKFDKVKIPKPGKSTPIVGMYIDGGALPASGSASASSAGKVRVQLFVGGINPVTGSKSNLSVSMSLTDSLFNATGQVDSDGDYTSDGQVIWGNVDCSTVTIP